MVNLLLLKNIIIMVPFFINDIISEDKQFLSYQEFQNKCIISTNFLEYYGIVGAVPEGWTILISEYGMLHCYMILKMSVLTN